MISCNELFNIFKKNNLTFFTGVPDSTFKGWMNFLETWHGKKLTQIIASNECEAVAIAAGYHLSSNKIGVVYMQNSGQGKTVNPITSLCDSEVYSIPVIMMIGWRGEPGKADEPQHKKMGRVLIPLLETLEIPYTFLPEDYKNAEDVIKKIKNIAYINKTPVAIIVKKGIISPYSSDNISDIHKNNFKLTREEAIKIIIENLSGSELIVSTTGKTSRELFEYRVRRKDKPMDFYTVGGMGCATSIALGIALQKPRREVFVFDGDGSVIMQMGSLATVGHYKPNNFNHILFDNESHDSTGGQMTVSSSIDFEKVALANGYNYVITVNTRADLINSIKKIQDFNGPKMIIVKIIKGSRNNLGRPTTSPIENKGNFMRFIRMG
jgi:phosphonopyruvate decarboxylase